MNVNFNSDREDGIAQHSKIRYEINRLKMKIYASPSFQGCVWYSELLSCIQMVSICVGTNDLLSEKWILNSEMEDQQVATPT